MSASHLHECQRTPSKSSRSSRWRGTIVTSSISHRKATSDGRSPGGCGNAMTARTSCNRAFTSKNVSYSLVSVLVAVHPRTLCILDMEGAN